jgi:hypothetical protein
MSALTEEEERALRDETSDPNELDYLIWSHEHGKWWGAFGCGYTRRLSEAGRYTRRDAILIACRAMPGTALHLSALPEIPVRRADVQEVADIYNGEKSSGKEPWE